MRQFTLSVGARMMAQRDSKRIDKITEMLAEVEDEMGSAFEYGAVQVGYIRKRPSSADGRMLPKIGDETIALWVNVDVDEDLLLDYLRADAEIDLPPGTRYEIRKNHPTNYGRTHGMAWYSNAAMKARETWGARATPAKPIGAYGYLLVGEYVTPAAPAASEV